jgi:hypothetical protein
MEYLDYQTYKKLGGKVDEAAFPNVLQKAVDKLNYFTLAKIEPCEEVERCLARMVDTMQEGNSGANISSFSNGNVSVSFADNQTADEQLYAIAEELLPISMLSRCI